jgi:hypothetical protein
MKYLLLVYMPEDAMTGAEREQCYSDSMNLCRELTTSGHFIDASPLQPISTATSVRVREGKHLVTDGPFAETREQLGGFYLVDVPDRQTAIEIAARIPPARKGTIEVRPLFELSGLPDSRHESSLPEGPA